MTRKPRRNRACIRRLLGVVAAGSFVGRSYPGRSPGCRRRPGLPRRVGAPRLPIRGGASWACRYGQAQFRNRWAHRGLAETGGRIVGLPIRAGAIPEPAGAPRLPIRGAHRGPAETGKRYTGTGRRTPVADTGGRIVGLPRRVSAMPEPVGAPLLPIRGAHRGLADTGKRYAGTGRRTPVADTGGRFVGLPIRVSAIPEPVGAPRVCRDG